MMDLLGGGSPHCKLRNIRRGQKGQSIYLPFLALEMIKSEAPEEKGW